MVSGVTWYGRPTLDDFSTLKFSLQCLPGYPTSQLSGTGGCDTRRWDVGDEDLHERLSWWAKQTTDSAEMYIDLDASHSHPQHDLYFSRVSR